MANPALRPAGPRTRKFPGVLRQLRTQRRMSQLSLALEAEVSTRHLSFLETGRAAPSREMVLALGRALDLPLRERNDLLLAAGFAPRYRETPLDAVEMSEARHALELILRQHEPLGALAMNRDFEIVMANRAFIRFMALLGVPLELTPYTVAKPPRPCALRQVLSPRLRAHVMNYDEIAAAVVARVEAELRYQPSESVQERLAVLRPELPPLDPEPTSRLLLPVEIDLSGTRLSLFSTISTLGTAQDVTLAELRIESFHAVDDATRALAQALAAAEDGPGA